MKLLLSLLPALAAAQTDYTSYAEQALAGLQSYYNETDGLWNTCGWWNGANCMTVIADLAKVDSNADVLSTATSVFGTTYTAAPAANPVAQVAKVSRHDFVETIYGPASGRKNARKSQPSKQTSDTVDVDGWLDSCYDDNSWWALAWIAAYDITNNTDYLDTASGIFNQNLTGAGPSPCGDGGIVWCENNPYVNAIANELYLSVAAHLANRISPNTQYVEAAQKQWAWFQSSGLINNQSLINDGLESNCVNTGERTVWSYNQGVILGALVELNKAAPNASLLTTANALASAAIKNLTDTNMVLHDVCEPNCAPDATQFKGIFVRNLIALQQASPSDQYVQVIQANANSIWANDRDSSTNTFSVDWAGPIVNPINASTSSSAMDALVAAISL